MKYDWEKGKGGILGQEGNVSRAPWWEETQWLKEYQYGQSVESKGEFDWRTGGEKGEFDGKSVSLYPNSKDKSLRSFKQRSNNVLHLKKIALVTGRE